MIHMLDTSHPANQAYLAGRQNWFNCWLERRSLASALRTADAFPEVAFALVIVATTTASIPS